MLIILPRLIYSPPSSNSMLSIFTAFPGLHDNKTRNLIYLQILFYTQDTDTLEGFDVYTSG